MIKAEGIIHRQVVDYLRYQYPNILFRSDYAAGMKMTMGQAMQHKRLQATRGWPDLFLAYPNKGKHGLFIELKADNVSLYLKDGSLTTNPHIREQEEVLKWLRELGYEAVFAKGYDQAVSIIDDYIGLGDSDSDELY